MKKETFIKSTIILIIGGFLTKALGMIIKIVMSRLMGSVGIGLYMLVLPGFKHLRNIKTVETIVQWLFFCQIFNLYLA